MSVPVIDFDLVPYIRNTRMQNGFDASEFKKYAHACTSAMPNLRRLAAPALVHKAAKRPFFFKPDFLKREDYGMVKIDEPLVRLITLEGERAFSSSLCLQQFLQSNDQKLQRLNFQALRRRQLLLLRRAIERAECLSVLAEKHGSAAFRLQCDIYCTYLRGLRCQEHDDYFEAVNLFHRCATMLELLSACRPDAGATEAMAATVKTQLSHATYMAQAYAGSDKEILQQIEIDAREAAEAARKEYTGALQSVCQDVEVDGAVRLTLYDPAARGQLSVPLPAGQVRKKLLKFTDQARYPLHDGCGREMEEIAAYYTGAINAVLGQPGLQPAIPTVFTPQATLGEPLCLRAQFRKITAALKAYRELDRVVSAALDRSNPPDPDRLQTLHARVRAALRYYEDFYARRQVDHFELGLYDQRFRGGARRVPGAVFTLLRRKLGVEGVGPQVVCQLAQNERLDPECRQLILTYYLSLLPMAACVPQGLVVRDAGKDLDLGVDIFYEAKISHGRQQETVRRVDPFRQRQLGYRIQLHLLRMCAGVCRPPAPGILGSEAVRSVLCDAITVVTFRGQFCAADVADAKPEEGLMLPAPVPLPVCPDGADCVAGELDFDDLLFDQAPRTETAGGDAPAQVAGGAAAEGAPKKKKGLFGLGVFGL